MKKTQLLLTIIISFATLFSNSAKAQKHIELSAAKSAQQCQEITAKGFTASFSFSGIDTREISTEKGTFSEISMSNTFPSGNLGEPSLPAAHQLIAIPFGASNVSIEVKNYSTTIYELSNYGIKDLAPQQASVRKDQEEIPFYYHAEAYQTKGYAERPIAQLELQGTMRGIQVGSLTVNPVQYDAANNTLKVFNDIEVEVNYGDYDPQEAYNEFARTASIYFLPMYRQMFNWRDDVYDQHPDLWQAPVKMLVIADRSYASSLQPWIEWKTKKGFYMDIKYIDEIGSSPSAVRSFCQAQYAQNAPTFLIIVGDKNQIPASATGSESHCVTDLYYESIDNDYYPEMLHSRMPVENVEQLGNLLEKSLEYEQYTMPDPSYLDNVLLIAGWDEAWNPKAGTPTIQYAVNYYYNAEHGFANVYDYYNPSGYAGCYDRLNTGVGFVNYTAHGANQHWENPLFTVNDVNNLTNTDKYFLAMGNCCLAADWGITGACFGEAMVRAPKKGAFAYIGSCPSTYWYEDYYFGVGANNTFYKMPSKEDTKTGVYDAIWMEDSYNTIQSMVYLGNLAVTYAHANSNYTTSASLSSPLYYWQSYHTLGDASIMPYHVRPTQNNVFHMSIIPAGTTNYEVSADPGSYVAISKDGVLLGTGLVDETGIANITLASISNGTATICVTHPQRIPYLEDIQIEALNDAYITIDNYFSSDTRVGEETSLNIRFKNSGTSATAGVTTVTLTCDNADVTITEGTATFNTLEAGSNIELDNFKYIIAGSANDGNRYHIIAKATCGSTVWENAINIIADKAKPEFVSSYCPGEFVPGETVTIAATFSNTGHYRLTNTAVTISSESPYLNFATPTVELGTIEPNGNSTASFLANISPDCPESELINILFNLTADGDLSAQGNGYLRNTCLVIFELADKWNDGWDNARLHVNYSDGTPDEDMTVSQGAYATYERHLAHGSHVTLTWQSGSWDAECSYIVRYEDGTVILRKGAQGGSFDVQCGYSQNLAPVENLEASTTGDNITLTWEQPAGSFRYRITRNGIVLGETTTNTYTDEAPNTETVSYGVTAIYADGESLPSYVQVTSDWSLDETGTTLRIFPNPTEGMLSIQCLGGECHFTLFNILGMPIKQGIVNGTLQLDTKDFAKGLYTVRIKDNNGHIITERVIVR